MTTLLRCNPDFEMRLARQPPPLGPAAEAAALVARLFALAGPMGSRVQLLLGDACTDLDGDALRRQARAAGLYDETAAAAAPWNTPGDHAVAYARDDRTAENPREEEVSARCNRKDLSAQLARSEGLEPGLFAHVRVVTSVDAIREALARVPDAMAAHWVLKPVLGFAGGGRVAGRGRTLPARAAARAQAHLRRDGALVLEPWVERLADHSTQLFVDDDLTVRLLFTLVLRNNASGRYRGNASLPADDPVRPALERAARVAGRWLAHAGYRGPAGVDAFVYRDPLTGAVEVRPLVEINARFTLGLLAAFAGTGGGRRAGFHFRFDTAQPFGEFRDEAGER
ncbi:MAG: hypothetical protein HY904_22685 [Deltaproteobacteria bacterium]|nr:hypothetical protein [Deltaproteobacteria bacterium]